jgi:hypothetical protein
VEELNDTPDAQPCDVNYFDGHWSDCGVIANDKLTWLNGVVTTVQISGHHIAMLLEGEDCRGKLQGSQIVWEDGDIWERVEGDVPVPWHADVGEDKEGAARDPPALSYDLSVARADIDMMQRQAQQLRSTIARRRDVTSANNPRDNIMGILSHYESVLSDLELRISELTQYVKTHSVASIM